LSVISIPIRARANDYESTREQQEAAARAALFGTLADVQAQTVAALERVRSLNEPRDHATHKRRAIERLRDCAECLAWLAAPESRSGIDI
jgi:hypothetical protein